MLVLVYNLIMFMKEVSYGILMVSVDFAKDGCDSVSPSTNLRRFRFRPKLRRTSPKAPPKRSKTSKAPQRPTSGWALRLM